MTINPSGLFSHLGNLLRRNRFMARPAIKGQKLVLDTLEARVTPAATYTLDFAAANPDLYNTTVPTVVNIDPTDLGNAGLSPIANANPVFDPTYVGFTDGQNLIPNAIYGTKAKDHVEQLASKDLVKGQIVPFVIAISAKDARGGTVAGDGGGLDLEFAFDHQSTNGAQFGYNHTKIGLYAAFIDSYADGFSTPTGGQAFVSTATWNDVDPINNPDHSFTAKVRVEGLDNKDKVVLELWVVLEGQSEYDAAGNVAGTVHAALVSAATIGSTPSVVSAGQQNVPLQLGAFKDDGNGGGGDPDGTPGISVSKTNDQLVPVVNAGTVVTYTVTIGNTGDVPLHGVTLTDAYESPNGVPVNLSGRQGDTSNDGILDVNETWIITYTQEVFQEDLDSQGNGDTKLTNVVVASGYSPSNVFVTQQSNSVVNLGYEPSLAINKVASVSVVDAAGQVIDYTITVANTGNITLTGLVLEDGFAAATLVSGDVDGDEKLDVDETWVYTASHEVTQDEMDAGTDLVNTATVTTGQTDEQSSFATTTIDQNPGLEILKVASVSVVDAAGQVINYTITVENTGNITLTGVVLDDEFAAATLVSGDKDEDGALDVGETWVYEASYVVTQDDMDAGTELVNVATVTTDSTEEQSDDAITTITQLPSLTIDKVADLSEVDAAGEEITYTITVENTGNITLTGVVLEDGFAAATLVSGDVDGDEKLDVDETWVYTASHEVTQDEMDAGTDLVNTATVTTGQTDEQSAFATTTIDQNAVIDVTKVGSKTTVVAIGQQIVYTITVFNGGNVSLTNPVVTDKFEGNTVTLYNGTSFGPWNFSGDNGTSGVLDVGETWTFTCTYTVTSANWTSNAGGDGKLSNEAKADAYFSSGSVSDSALWDVNLFKYTTYSMGGYGGTGNPGTVLNNLFSTNTLTSIVVQRSGTSSDIVLDTAKKVGDFLRATNKSPYVWYVGAVKNTYIPTTLDKQFVALKVNVALSPGLLDLKIVNNYPGVPNGTKVSNIIDQADKFMNNSGYTLGLSQGSLTALLDNLNLAYHEGTSSSFAATYLSY